MIQEDESWFRIFVVPKQTKGALSTVSVVNHASHVVFIVLGYFYSLAYSVQLDYIVLI